MKLSKLKSEIISNWLAKSDIAEISGILGVSDRQIRYILSGERSYNTPTGWEVIRVIIRRAKQNKSFRTLKVA